MSNLPVLPFDSLPWQSQFLAVLPAVKARAALRFRYLPPEARAEATQEAIASACVAFQRMAVLGRQNRANPGSLADFAVKHVRGGRHVGGSQDAARDVLSPATRHRQRVRLVSYDSHEDGDNWGEVVSGNRRCCVADLAAFRIDFAEWLKEMGERDRRIIAALAGSERTADVAERFGLTPGRVSQLRRMYERRWQLYQGEVAYGDAG
jgi:hypothetical protein